MTRSEIYFTFDEPVPYPIKNCVINIVPVKLKNKYNFLSSADILSIDKNSYPDVKIIQMSYLQFLCEVILNSKDEKAKELAYYKFYSIMHLCLGIQIPKFYYNENGVNICDDSNPQIIITAKQFDDIRRIIMHQNIPNYDDSYVNPSLQRAMNDTDKLKNKGIEVPTLERQMAIITAHTGLPKKEQLDMTCRSHEMLFEEVCGEVEFTTVRPVALFSGEGKNFDHWIFKKDKNKFDGYITTVDAYAKNIGGSQAIKSSDSTTLGDSYMQQFNNF